MRSFVRAGGEGVLNPGDDSGVRVVGGVVVFEVVRTN